MKPFLFFILCSIVFPLTLQAQRENNIWCFGRNKSLDFNGATPVLGTSKVSVFESSASVCNRDGHLLFYMGSDTVWNGSHQHMPNGTGMLGNYSGSSYRGVSIVRFPGDTSKYYIFTTDAIEQNRFNAYYSVVDMNLNGGLGDVVAGQKNIRLDSNVVEGICVLPMKDCNGYWVSLHKKGSTDFHAYRIDAGGLTTVPVVSQGVLAASSATYSGYHFRPNNAGNGIAGVGSSSTELGSFNATTGLFSNFHVLDTSLPSPTFSPDDSKLYGINATGLHQVDLSLIPNMAATLGSIRLIDSGNYQGARLGPDQKLYVVRWAFWPATYYTIARVPYPNATGTAAGIERNFIAPIYGLPFLDLGCEASVPQELTSYSRKDTVICNSASVTLTTDPAYRDLLWSTGNALPQETISLPGTYWLRGRKQCNLFVDTFHITFQNLDHSLLPPDTSICPGDTITLSVSVPGASYQWQDGSTADTLRISRPGQYSISANSTPCSYRDTIRITLLEPFAAIVQPDTTICAGAMLTLQAEASPGSSLLWSTGATDNTTAVKESGSYSLTATNSCGVFMDSVRIDVEDCICKPFIPNAFSPNGDGKNDRLRVFFNCPGTTRYQFSMYNRYGQLVFRSTRSGEEWDGAFNGQQADMGTYFYYLEYKNQDGAMIKKKGDIILLR